MLCLTATAQFFKVPDTSKATQLYVEVTFITSHCLQQTEAASNLCREADALLSHRPEQKSNGGQTRLEDIEIKGEEVENGMKQHNNTESMMVHRNIENYGMSLSY